MKGKGLKLKEDGFGLGKGKKFVTVSVVRRWGRLCREDGGAPSLEVPGTRLGGLWAGGDGSLPMAGG